MYRVALLAAALIGSASVASAADLGSYKEEPVASYGPGFSWAGLYIGGSAGFGVGDTQKSVSNFDCDRCGEGVDRLLGSIPSLSIADYDLNGAIYGAHIGYNFQRGNIVFGVEAGINGTEMDGSSPLLTSLITANTEIDWYATATARLGYASGKTLFYGFGGAAWADVKDSVKVAGFSIYEDESSHLGWTAGLGIEHAISDRFIVRVEYSHVDLGEETTTIGIGPLSFDKTSEVEFDAIKVGASYKFGGREHEPLK
jgi:outer membrane immunogenic protein